MPRRLLPTLLLAVGAIHAQAAELRLMTHASFELPKPLIADFERQAGVKLTVIKAGDAGEMLNKLILTRANPIADVVYGIDNTLAAKAVKAGVLDAAPTVKTAYALPGGLAAIDYGVVTLNVDKAWFAKNKKALPRTLAELATPAYKDLFVVQNPATSSPGLAFLVATVDAMGEEAAFAWWAKLRDNGLKVAKGWSEAYYTDFSKNGGARPIVVSYATSPAAEVFYGKEKLNDAPTASLPLPGASFLQVEGAAPVKGGREPAAARRFVAWLQSAPVQKALQTGMWMYPAVPGTTLAPVFRFAPQPAGVKPVDAAKIDENAQRWVTRWTRVVIKGGR
ncbi:thiamine ABC transporter substrate-binding protein [Crenobacter cavernae]|uniref:Thiamine ABC transporter substrate-binding protein n=1 Tax=Crenobacter cavernae TaxID=2290923 RepID=A0ABY0FJW8_9NEIS|nr:thiamine ABC transporter substrate-binding protein [Crenobacter cavernae]RXZ45679.1 thiamine ABC transporter substrate-binding protein [Crenobacter cavernae]